jgi:hypothetical protein
MEHAALDRIVHSIATYLNASFLKIAARLGILRPGKPCWMTAS